jgi:hypothetical protein
VALRDQCSSGRRVPTRALSWRAIVKSIAHALVARFSCRVPHRATKRRADVLKSRERSFGSPWTTRRSAFLINALNRDSDLALTTSGAIFNLILPQSGIIETRPADSSAELPTSLLRTRERDVGQICISSIEAIIRDCSWRGGQLDKG